LTVWQVLTKDSVTVSVDAVVYYRVSNATVSVANVENAHHSTRLLAQTTLRNVLGTKNLSEILSEREAISNMMQVRGTHILITGLPFCVIMYTSYNLQAFRNGLFGPLGIVTLMTADCWHRVLITNHVYFINIFM